VIVFEKINEILDFWLGMPGEDIKQIAPIWWKADPDFDNTIRERFLAVHEAGQQKKLKAWCQSPKSCLAYIVLFDQFSRNMFRGTKAAFQYDPLALTATESGIENKLDRELGLIERLFFYMPLEHSELMINQDKSLVMFKLLLDEARDVASPLVDILQEAYTFAIKHFEVIQQFGRFPHRNVMLGRESTKQELIYLEEFPSGF
jgi:uncharacterized protein (DUF924 family)